MANLPVSKTSDLWFTLFHLTGVRNSVREDTCDLANEGYTCRVCEPGTSCRSEP